MGCISSKPGPYKEAKTITLPNGEVRPKYKGAMSFYGTRGGATASEGFGAAAIT